jgi:hypothetical protein
MRELKQFLQTRWVELLVAGVWLQSVISAVFSGSLALMALTTLGGLALLVVIFWLVRRISQVRSQRQLPAYGDSEAFAAPRQAVVFTVGRQKDTVLLALSAQRPEWLGLICSRETASIADEIKNASGLDEGHVQPEIVDAWSVVEVRAKTGYLLDWLARHGVSPAETAVDITGGTSIMSAGAFSVAAERGIDCQYVRSDYDEDNRPKPNTQRGVFVTRYGQAEA